MKNSSILKDEDRDILEILKCPFERERIKLVSYEKKWSKEETEKLLELARIHGRDYTKLAQHFPTFKRDRVKAKLKTLIKTQPKSLSESHANLLKELA